MEPTVGAPRREDAIASRAKPCPVDAALRAGLRAIDATTLPSFDPTHTRRGRAFLLTYHALADGLRPSFEVVAMAPQLVDRVECILAEPEGDAALERLARWADRGGLDA